VQYNRLPSTTHHHHHRIGRATRLFSLGDRSRGALSAFPALARALRFLFPPAAAGLAAEKAGGAPPHEHGVKNRGSAPSGDQDREREVARAPAAPTLCGLRSPASSDVTPSPHKMAALPPQEAAGSLEALKTRDNMAALRGLVPNMQARRRESATDLS